MAACSAYGPIDRVASERSTRLVPFGDLRAIPQRAVLVRQEHQLAVGRRARGTPRLLQQHEGEQTDRLGIGQELDQKPPYADRLGGQVDARHRAARRGRVAFVEHQVDDAQHRIEALRQLVGFRHLVGNARVADLALRADDALGERRRAGEERLGDLLGRQAAHLAQRQRDLRVDRERRVTAREDEAQAIVLDPFAVVRGRLVGDCLDYVRDVVERREAAVATDRRRSP